MASSSGFKGHAHYSYLSDQSLLSAIPAGSSFSSVKRDIHSEAPRLSDSLPTKAILSPSECRGRYVSQSVTKRIQSSSIQSSRNLKVTSREASLPARLRSMLTLFSFHCRLRSKGKSKAKICIRRSFALRAVRSMQ